MNSTWRPKLGLAPGPNLISSITQILSPTPEVWYVFSRLFLVQCPGLPNVYKPRYLDRFVPLLMAMGWRPGHWGATAERRDGRQRHRPHGPLTPALNVDTGGEFRSKQWLLGVSPAVFCQNVELSWCSLPQNAFITPERSLAHQQIKNDVGNWNSLQTQVSQVGPNTSVDLVIFL